MIEPTTLASLPPSALTARLYEIRKKERALLVEFLAYLAEVDRRKVHVAAGYSSLFAFLVEFLGYSNSSAFRRMRATQLLARFPVIAEYLADGRLCLSTLIALGGALDDETHRATLDRAAGKTEDEVKLLVATLLPKPAPRDMLRRLPAPPGDRPRAAAPVTAGPAVIAPPPSPPPRPRLEPISEELRVLRVTVGREFVADLHACAPRSAIRSPTATSSGCCTSVSAARVASSSGAAPA